MSSNPYAAPKAAVADAATPIEGNFVPGGRGVPAGRGWEWIAGGWEMFKKQPGTWIGLIVIALVLTMVLAFIPLIGPIALMVIWPAFGAGVMIGCRALQGGGALEIGHLFAGFRDRFGTLAAVGALYLAAYAAIMLLIVLIFGFGMAGMMMGTSEVTAGTAMTMVLASLISAALMLPMAMAIWFAPTLVVFHERGAVEAMKESFFGCLKNILPFLVYGVIGMVIAVVASIPLGLGWLVAGPVFAASIYVSYRDIYFTS